MATAYRTKQSWNGSSRDRQSRTGKACCRRSPRRFRLAHHWTLVTIFYISSLLIFPAAVKADCECGYATSFGADGAPKARYVFTDLLESNFRRLKDISLDTDWVRQEFNISGEKARGDYGEMFLPDNIQANSQGNGGSNPDTEGTESPGLQLTVKNHLVDGMVPVAEIDSKRPDLLWGTFRASMKMTAIPGTCAAFFWYFNDTQEIDMEFLSKDFNTSNNSYPVNLVLQSNAALANHDASSTGYFSKIYLPFNPTTDYHEYRFDYIPGQVFFYADGALLAQMNGSAVPTSPGHLILQHWSNGNAFWSGGPPAQDAVLTVAYVKAYFNSSSSQRLQDWRARCRDPNAEKAVCTIPEIDSKNKSAADWFFSDHDNMTNNQTVYDESMGSSLARGWGLWSVMTVLFAGSGGIAGLW
ncbi:glycoside hydrolase, family 16 [Naviculisporaceae sp. PSN 640]